MTYSGGGGNVYLGRVVEIATLKAVMIFGGGEADRDERENKATVR